MAEVTGGTPDGVGAQSAPAEPGPKAGLVRLSISLALLGTGEAMTAVGLPLLVIQKFGLGPAAGVALAVGVVPGVVFAGPVGTLIDRNDAKRIAIVSSFASALVVPIFPHAEALWQVQVIALFAGLAWMFGFPARMRLRAAVIPEGDEVEGNSLLVAADRSAGLVGPLIASAVIAVSDISLVFYVEAVGAVGAALLLAGLPGLPSQSPSSPEVTAEPAQGGISRAIHALFLAPLREFASLLRRDRFVGALTYTSFFYVAAVDMGRVMLAAYAVSQFESSPGAYGVLLAALAVGGVLGALAGRSARRLPPGWVYVVGNLAEAACWPVLVFSHALAPALILAGIAGAFESIATVVYFAEVQGRLPNDFVGRYYSVLMPITDVCGVIGTVVGATLLPSLGVEAVAGIIAAVIAAPFLVVSRTIIRE
jgi:MFS family permease